MKIIFKSKIYFSIINCDLYIFRRNPKVVPNQTKTPHSINTLFIYQIRFALAQHTQHLLNKIYLGKSSKYDAILITNLGHWLHPIESPSAIRQWGARSSNSNRLKPYLIESTFVVDRNAFICSICRTHLFIYLFYLSQFPHFSLMCITIDRTQYISYTNTQQLHIQKIHSSHTIYINLINRWRSLNFSVCMWSEAF